MKDNVFLVDTNILVYAYEKGESIKKKRAMTLLEKCWNHELMLAISNQNLSEFVFVVVKKGGLQFQDAQEIIQDIIQFEGFQKINYSASTVLLAAELAHRFSLSFWDSLLTATMKEHGIENIYTENVKDFKVPGLHVINILH